MIDPEVDIQPKQRNLRDSEHSTTSDFSEPSDSSSSGEDDKTQMTLQDQIKRSIIKGIPLSKEEKKDILMGRVKS